MRMMVGLTRPDHGDVRYHGVRYSRLQHPARVVGSVLDARCMHPGRTARNHLRAIAALSAIPARRVDEVLDEVGLETAADQRAGGFSLGMRQRLALAGALLGEPEVLLLDEPSNGLDPDGIRWLRNSLRAFAAKGGTVFVSSHLIGELAMFADDLVVVGGGRLLAAEPLADDPRPRSVACRSKRSSLDMTAPGRRVRRRLTRSPDHRITDRSPRHQPRNLRHDHRQRRAPPTTTPPLTVPTPAMTPRRTVLIATTSSSPCAPDRRRPCASIRRRPVRSEWIKVRSLRSTPAILALTLVIGVLLSWILATFVKTDPDTHVPFTVGQTFIFSTWLTTVLAAIIGTLAVHLRGAARHARHRRHRPSRPAG